MLASKLRPLCASSESTSRGLSACASRFLGRPVHGDGVANPSRVNGPNLRKSYSSMDFFDEVTRSERPNQARGRGSSFLRRKGEQARTARRTIVPVDQVLADINLELHGNEDTTESRETIQSVSCPRSERMETLLDGDAPRRLRLPPMNSNGSSKWDKPRLDVPTEYDDLKGTLFKVQHLCEAIEQGRSIGRFSALKFAANPIADAERSVCVKLDPHVRRMYFAWKYTVYNPRHGLEQGPNAEEYRGDVFKLPNMNWRDNVAPVPTGLEARAKFISLAEAVDVVFGYRGATLEHAMWIKKHKPRIMLLVVIVRKILFLERHRRLDQAPKMPGLKREEAADVQTIRRVVAQANANLSRELTNYLEAVHKDPAEAGETIHLGDLLQRVNELNGSLTFLQDHAKQLENKCMKDYHFTNTKE